MNQDTSYYALIHGERASSPSVDSFYSHIARIIDYELNVVRNSDQPMWNYERVLNLIHEDLPPNPYDLKVQPELAFKEREKLLTQLFGGGEFAGFIGEVALYHERVPKAKEETIFHNRVSKLTLSLSSELSRWTPLSQSQYLSDAIRKDIEPHITHLSSLPFGPQLLHAIGYIYVSKAHEWMADNSISTRMFARVRNRKPEWQRVRELTVKAMDKFSDDSVHLGFMIRNRDLYKRLSDRDFEVSVQYNTLAILSKFIKMVWLGTVSDIESVLDSVCEKAINRSSKPKRTAKALEAYGKCLRQAYQRSSRRHNSIFYWDMFSCTGEDIYWLDSGYSEHPERVTAKNGQKLLPDTARYEYVEYGIGDPSNLVDFDQYRRNKYRRGRKPGTEGSSYAGSSGGGYGGGGDGGGDGGGCGGDGGGGGGGDGGGC